MSYAQSSPQILKLGMYSVKLWNAREMAMLKLHIVFDQLSSILNHFRHHKQHLTHVLLTLEILHRASGAYHNYTQLYIPAKKIVARNSSIHCWCISSSILLHL